jgi:hypothetical protein
MPSKPVKLKRKQFPAGYSPDDFKYQGRPAKDQGDFGVEVGLADAACVNQFGEANNAKYYHAGVLQTSDGQWWVYLEWGRIKPGKSWNGSFRGQDFQFVKCADENEARTFFFKQMKSKNLARLEKKDIGGTTIWASKVDKRGKSKDGYIVQSLATRERGLPDAYIIKDDSGVQKDPTAPKKTPARKKASSLKSLDFQPQVVALAQSLVGGTKSYARAASEATGIVPTMEAIIQVRDKLLPLALKRIKNVGDNVDLQVKDSQLIDISKMVAALVPTVIPRRATQEERQRMTILSTANILQRQQDLDAFEAAILNEDFDVSAQSQAINPDILMNATIRWIDPNSKWGRWLAYTYTGMTNNRHGHLRGKKLRILNMFSVVRPDRDAKFVAEVKKVAAKRKGKVDLKARLQPSTRPDVSDISDLYGQANIFLGIHGTRAVNVQPIISSNLRLPRTLKGVHITGAMFGGGIYAATDYRKSLGYCGVGNSYYGSGGQIQGRGWFMFLQDYIMGQAYKAPSTGSWTRPPNGCDSVAAYPDFMRSLVNDEHIIYNPDYQRIRYIIEGKLV